MSKKYRVIETEKGFYVQVAEKYNKPKHLFLGFIEVGVVQYEKWVYAKCHGKNRTLGLGPVFQEDSVFETLDEAKQEIEVLKKYEQPIVHEV